MAQVENIGIDDEIIHSQGSQIWSEFSILTPNQVQTIALYYGFNLKEIRAPTMLERVHHPPTGYMSLSC